MKAHYRKPPPRDGGRLPPGAVYQAITGLWLGMASFQTFVFVLLQRAAAMVATRLREATR